MHNLLRILLFLVVPLYGMAAWGSTQLSVSETNGLPLVSAGGASLLTADYVFWGENWRWAGTKTTVEANGNFDYRTFGTNKRLQLQLSARTQKTSKNQLRWELTLDANKPSENAIGGGIAFHLDLSGLRTVLGEPVLLPGNSGWNWGNVPDSGVLVEFEPATAMIQFVRKKKSEIRVFFYQGTVPEGPRKFTMKVTLFGNAELKPNLEERFHSAESSAWPEDRLEFESFPIDLSGLNSRERPAGKRGFVRAMGEKLVFEDGSQARFWGTNITASTLFKTSKLNIRKQAARLSRMGFNLVRLHHHDSFWVKPNIFGPETVSDTQNLDKGSLDKLDWWIKCLKDEGIYVWLDLHVQRYLRAGDNISSFNEIDRKSRHPGADLKGYNYVNDSIKDAMKRFNRSYVDHVNPYTHLAYKDEPAIMAMLITNENDITNHYGNALLPNKKVPLHDEIYMRKAKAFAKQHGLKEGRIWRSWEHGSPKLFLNDLEHRFNIEMIKDLRQAGVKVPIATTNTWGNNPLSSLPALTDGDLIDVHAYGDPLELEKNPLFAAGMVGWMSAGQVANKPMTVSEWNVTPFPVPDRHTSPLLVASKACHQGWDALIQYAYSQNSLNREGKPSNWHVHNDPAMLSMLPAAALLYRRGQVQEASTIYVLDIGAKLFDEAVSPKTSIAIRTASEKGKLLIGMPEMPSLPWLQPTRPPKDAVVLRDYRQSLLDRDVSFVKSDTGELYRNWENGLYTIDTPRSQAAMGWMGGKSIELSNTRFQLDTVNATVAVQSLDDKPISGSEKILISLGSNSVPYKDLKGRSRIPFLSQPITGHIRIEAQKGLRVYSIDNLGMKIELPGIFDQGWYGIDLGEAINSHWLMLEKS